MQTLLLILAILTILGVAIDVSLLLFVLKSKHGPTASSDNVISDIFGGKAKRKPVYNDDEKAWLKENDRA